ncbi:RluA family pseudouridine synthase [Halothiobacillus sp. DCM-1]|uniref:RluA family pseudouridine synthase n=1 Tax=Halothiobacillus sp. DCM-1 TaxID=3112558 RepID=UPI0032514AA4
MNTYDAAAARVRRVTVTSPYDGQRIDNFLLRELGATQGTVPRTLIYRILRTGEVRINSQRAKPTTRVRTGDEIRIPPIKIQAAPSSTLEIPESWLSRVPEMIVYEDESLLVIDKPAGLAVHGGSGIAFGLIELLRTATQQGEELELAHRLDRETSGLILLAKTRTALHALQTQLRPEGQAEKRYDLIVHGRWPAALQRVEAPLEKWQGDGAAHRVQVTASGKSAVTHFSCRAQAPQTSLMQAQLHTGRTHQIRVHAAHVGHPIVGDEKYGQRALDKALGLPERPPLMLHAAQLTLHHPRTNQAMRFSAPPPASWRAVLTAAGFSSAGLRALFSPQA